MENGAQASWTKQLAWPTTQRAAVIKVQDVATGMTFIDLGQVAGPPAIGQLLWQILKWCANRQVGMKAFPSPTGSVMPTCACSRKFNFLLRGLFRHAYH